LTASCRAARTATTTRTSSTRYDQGPPYAGISDDEAIGRYQQVAPELSPDLYQQSAQDALGRMAPEERAQFGQLLQQRAQQQGVDLPGLGQARGSGCRIQTCWPSCCRACTSSRDCSVSSSVAVAAPVACWAAGVEEQGHDRQPAGQGGPAGIAAMAAKRMLR
jgi:hypothetical protein